VGLFSGAEGRCVWRTLHRWEVPPAAAVLPRAPNFHVGARWSSRCGARSPGAYVPGSVGVCGSLVADHTRNSDSWREPPREIRRSSACSRGLVPSPEGRMPQPASARKGV
ncbi:hypothetical protein PENANT_c221G09601, partial [Penicillium antarcticum]